MICLFATLAMLQGATEARVAEATPGPTPSPVASPAVVEATEAGPASTAWGRFEVGQTVTADSDTDRHLVLTDLRVTTEATGLTNAELSFKIDGRGQWSWNALSDHRLWLTDVYLRQGGPASGWRFTAGRQTMRAVASAQVDGLAVERRLGPTARLLAFAGLMPHPVTNLPNTDFTTAGLGYELGTGGNHAGGVVLSLYRFSLDRLYLTHRSTAALTPQLTLTAMVIADMVSPEGLFGTGTPDLTSALLLLRFRPVRLLDLSLSATHQHTIVPGAWWQDWMSEELHKRGFVIDGVQPLGTRISSARLTINVPTRLVVPFVRLRADVRHTTLATGFEGLGGVRVRPGRFFVLVQGGWRRYFEAQAATVSADAGLEGDFVSFQVGGSMLNRRPIGGTQSTLLYEAHAIGWLDLGQLLSPLKGVMLSAQYEGMFDALSQSHVAYALVGYRF